MISMLRPGALAFVALMLGACGSGFAGGEGSAGRTSQIIVGSANFPENELLADLYAGALSAKGHKVTKRLDVGTRETLLPAMKRGDITVLPEYTGGLLTFLSNAHDLPRDTRGQVTALRAALPAGLEVLEPSRAQDQNTVTCTSEVARTHRLRSLEDLAQVSHSLTIGGPPELAERDGFGSLDGLRRVYGITFKQFRPLDESGPLTVEALKSGKIDCANLFSTQPAIAVNGFVSLSDPKHFAQSEAIIPLVSKTVATREVRATLNAVSATLTTDELKRMVEQVVTHKSDPAQVAEGFLRAHGLI